MFQMPDFDDTVNGILQKWSSIIRIQLSDSLLGKSLVMVRKRESFISVTSQLSPLMI